ncbi:MAG: pyrimidine dimer DNA glycosylase [Candidatus Omnitrophica bacterium]|nr:pyrimidine dimer DNA glycosylase [Candidatus Omnitrophota bacterium]
MRIWDLSPKRLCRSHLLGEHRELHAIWSVITGNRLGYSRHPETLRWRGKLKALYLRHELLVQEMEKRGYNHKSPLEKRFARGKAVQRAFIDSRKEQRVALRKKKCGCKV